MIGLCVLCDVPVIDEIVVAVKVNGGPVQLIFTSYIVFEVVEVDTGQWARTRSWTLIGTISVGD